MAFSLLVVSASADFSSTDSSRLSTINTNVSTIKSTLSTYLGDIYTQTLKLNNINTNIGLMTPAIQNIEEWADTIAGRLLSESHGPAYWARYTYQKGLTSDQGNFAANLLEDIKASNASIKSYTNSIKTSNQGILDFLTAEKQKEEDAMSDYSSSGGKSASDTSSDVGAISGSLSSSFNSGVSASSALDAVDENEDTFQYFFFEMKDDLNTTSSGSSKAPLRGSKSSSGSSVPDFLSDYWGGLNG